MGATTNQNKNPAVATVSTGGSFSIGSTMQASFGLCSGLPSRARLDVPVLDLARPGALADPAGT